MIHKTSIARVCSAFLATCATASVAFAHHTYAMFDMTKATSIEGRVAKLEFKNPHISVWLYVPGAKKGEYDLWRFQSSSVGMSMRDGWSATVLHAGEPLTMHYFPLRNGEKGGYLIRVVRPDGSQLIGDPDAPGVGKELAKSNSLPKKSQ